MMAMTRLKKERSTTLSAFCRFFARSIGANPFLSVSIPLLRTFSLSLLWFSMIESTAAASAASSRSNASSSIRDAVFMLFTMLADDGGGAVEGGCVAITFFSFVRSSSSSLAVLYSDDIIVVGEERHKRISLAQLRKREAEGERERDESVSRGERELKVMGAERVFSLFVIFFVNLETSLPFFFFARTRRKNAAPFSLVLQTIKSRDNERMRLLRR